ncbi:F-box protein SKIP28 [Magnolia sinica]|uniref:F-box protein SKIP28 n=1 Tax=Magnolia sinica TaxID=86752 RepID=UPI002657E85C|nr:F-box protein SKIP28 [Magnolia sinica]
MATNSPPNQSGTVPVSLLSPMAIPEERPSSPHQAFFFVLAHFRLRELFTIRQVCKSLRHAIDSDPLLWLDVSVEPPLSFKITDSTLLDITARAHGRLRSLVLIECKKVTDDALRRIAESNPGISKLYVPGCVNITPAGIVRVVGMLGNLKCLRIYGLLNITKEHLNSISALLHVNSIRPPMFYNTLLSSQHIVDDHPIDVDICPKCKDVRLIFDCPREHCREMKGRFLPCRGCFFCIARCEECGGCIDFEDLGEGTVCMHLLCSECWLRLPKCMLCNKPSCNRHCYPHMVHSGPDGFTCDRCISKLQISQNFEEGMFGNSIG